MVIIGSHSMFIISTVLSSANGLSFIIDMNGMTFKGWSQPKFVSISSFDSFSFSFSLHGVFVLIQPKSTKHKHQQCRHESTNNCVYSMRWVISTWLMHWIHIRWFIWADPIRIDRAVALPLCVCVNRMHISLKSKGQVFWIMPEMNWKFRSFIYAIKFTLHSQWIEKLNMLKLNLMP